MSALLPESMIAPVLRPDQDRGVFLAGVREVHRGSRLHRLCTCESLRSGCGLALCVVRCLCGESARSRQQSGRRKEEKIAELPPCYLCLVIAPVRELRLMRLGRVPHVGLVRTEYLW